VTGLRGRGHIGGGACYDKKLAKGKTPKEFCVLERQISDGIHQYL
jgi:hypothetical protein